MAPKQYCCLTSHYHMMCYIIYQVWEIDCWDFFFIQRRITPYYTQSLNSLVFHTTACLLEVVVFSLSHRLAPWSFLLCYRFGGNTWSWMKATEWRITTASWLRSWTLTMWPPEGSSWLGPRCRISSQNSGPSLTSSSPPFSRVAAHLNSGLTLHLPWLEKGYWPNFCIFHCMAMNLNVKNPKPRMLEPREPVD